MSSHYLRYHYGIYITICQEGKINCLVKLYIKIPEKT